MRINGEWLLCDDGIVRPMVSGELIAASGHWEAVEFLVDIGADRTVLSAAMLSKLGLPTLVPDAEISGLGGMTGSVLVETKLHLVRDTGGPVVFNSRWAAVTDPAALDLSVLGRDITDLFAVIIDYPGNVVCLLSQRHRYTIIQV